MSELSLADRATIANMSPEYGATMGFFPVDHVTLQYLKLTGRSDETVCIFYVRRIFFFGIFDFLHLLVKLFLVGYNDRVVLAGQ